MKHPQQFVTAALVGLALAGTAHGQATPGSGSAGGGAGAGATTSTAPAKMMTKDAEASHALKAVRLSALDGVDLFDAGNKKIGEIDDILVDPKTGSIHQVVVETGGVAGVGGKKHAAKVADLKLFSRAADDTKPVKATLAKAPDSFPAADKAGKDSPYVGADKYLGMNVVDASGKKIGEVEDLVVDMSGGQASYALVEFDQSWSPKDKLFAFKPADLMPGKDANTLQVNANRDTLDQLPSLDRKVLDKSDLSRMPTATK